MNNLTPEPLAAALAIWLGKRQWQLLLSSPQQFAWMVTTDTLTYKPTATIHDVKKSALHQLSEILYQHLTNEDPSLQHTGCIVLYEYCLGLARNWCDAKESAENVAQQSTVYVLRQLPKVRVAGAFLGLCKTITRRTLAAELKAEASQHLGRSLDQSDDMGNLDGRLSLDRRAWVDDFNPIDQLTSQLSRPVVWRHIQIHTQLSARERLLVLCHYRDGIGRADLCRQLNLSANALDVALHRAIHKLRHDPEFVNLLRTCL